MAELLKRIIILDVDGTVWNSEPDIFLSFQYTLKKHAGFDIDWNKFKELAGLPLSTMFKNVLPSKKDDDVFIAFLEKEYKKYYIEEGHFIDSTVLFPCVEKVLHKFKEEGFILTVASSKPKCILLKMVEYFDLPIDLILGTEESSINHKPNPEIIDITLEKFNISKEDAVIIGDSKADILAGKNAGIDTIAVSYGFEKKEVLFNLQPNFLIDSFGELENIIKYKIL